ncbi:MAG: tripartite tricarboxylate transporter TctB family protein [bacterium]
MADRAVALVLFFGGLGVAWKSAELPIGILPREGPGGGFLPFWLSLGISAVAVVVFLRTFINRPAEGEEGAEEVFITREGVVDLLRVGIPGLLMILLIDVISIYLAAALFVFYCLYYVGRHGLITCTLVTLGAPFGVFLIFEKFLIIPLPKGYLEFVFYMN